MTFLVSGRTYDIFITEQLTSHFDRVKSNHQNFQRKLIKFEIRCVLSALLWTLVKYTSKTKSHQTTLPTENSNLCCIGKQTRTKTPGQDMSHTRFSGVQLDSTSFAAHCKVTKGVMLNIYEKKVNKFEEKLSSFVANLELEREISAQHSSLRWRWRLRCRWSFRLKIAEEKYWSAYESWIWSRFSWFTSVVSVSCELLISMIIQYLHVLSFTTIIQPIAWLNFH